LRVRRRNVIYTLPGFILLLFLTIEVVNKLFLFRLQRVLLIVYTQVYIVVRNSDNARFFSQMS